MYKYDAESKLIKSYVYDSETMTNSFGDENGCPIGMKYRTPSMAQDVYECFFFEKNLQGDIVSVYNSNGVKIISYTYDAWGNFIQTHTGGGVSDISIATKNPFRYRGYYYDTETGFYYLQSRYYNPNLGRFIQSADISNLNPYSINGLNLYNYAYNNSVSIAYSNYHIGGMVSGGMASSVCGGTFVEENSLGEIFVTNNVSNGGNVGFKLSWPKANVVAMTHHTTPLIENMFFNTLVGNISYIVTVQLNDAEMFYSYSNVGDSGVSYGVGVNFSSWYGVSAYVSSNIGFGTSVQATPWVTYGAEISLVDGVSVSFGAISGNTTQEVSVNVGWGTMVGAYAVAVGMSALPVPGARIAAGATACVILLVDIFN